MTESPSTLDERPLSRRPDGEEPVEFRRVVEGVGIAGFEWAGDGPPIVMVHGTGHHARIWDEVARALPGRRVIALDLRGHGRSDRPPPPYDWARMSTDIVGVIEALGLRDVIGVGHSMGGYCVADAARQRLDAFAAMVLVNPTIFEPRPETENAGSLDFVRKRRNEWASPEEMIERFEARFPFSAWAPGVLRDYAVYGLLPALTGEGYVLACPPDVEADVYAGRSLAGATLTNALGGLTLPTHILRARVAEPGEKVVPFTVSVTMPNLVDKLPQAQDFSFPRLSHFIPQEAPDLVARHVIEVANSLS